MDALTALIIGGSILIAAGVLAMMLRGRRDTGAAQMTQLTDTAARLAETQSMLTGRLAQMAESQAAAQNHMAEQLRAQETSVRKLLDERLADVTRKVGENLEKSTTKNSEALGALSERLAVIDAAQKNITELSAEVVGLQDILSNKQARGVVGQRMMEDLVSDVLPKSAYDFQTTLSNGRRPDCVIRLPNPPGLIVVDAKYPLDAYRRMIDASDERERTTASQALRTDVLKHIRDIAEKYIIPGETADSAIMFVPAGSVHDYLHDNFPDIMDECYKRRVFIVSSVTFMATLTTVRSILKDARMREQAHIIQKEIGELMKDVGRLDERVKKLGNHFDLAQRDVKDVLISTGKIIDRGKQIENIPLEAETAQVGDNVTQLRVIAE
jgi:DNA recombination protein RmuC